MTDKQIIIDGVDVTDCEYCSRYANTTIYHCECTGECKEHPNCHYKNWKRKEEECERLKQGYAELTEIVSPYMDDFTGYNEELGGFDLILCVKELMEQLDQLKAENRELKAVHSTNVALSDELFKYKAENEDLKEYIKHLHNLCGNETDKQYRYKQTLDEIKEIAEENIRIADLEGLNGVYRRGLAKQILQKISECEVTNG